MVSSIYGAQQANSRNKKTSRDSFGGVEQAQTQSLAQAGDGLSSSVYKGVLFLSGTGEGEAGWSVTLLSRMGRGECVDIPFPFALYI